MCWYDVDVSLKYVCTCICITYVYMCDFAGINAQFALTSESIPIFRSILTSIHPALFRDVHFNVHTPSIHTHPHHSRYVLYVSF
ncbi:hypothetical protein EON63_16340 [archaeon]|nr:MAG: hypothetical protein EON63_16340 [archaeon]